MFYYFNTHKWICPKSFGTLKWGDHVQKWFARYGWNTFKLNLTDWTLTWQSLYKFKSKVLKYRAKNNNNCHCPNTFGGLSVCTTQINHANSALWEFVSKWAFKLVVTQLDQQRPTISARGDGCTTIGEMSSSSHNTVTSPGFNWKRVVGWDPLCCQCFVTPRVVRSLCQCHIRWIGERLEMWGESKHLTSRKTISLIKTRWHWIAFNLLLIVDDNLESCTSMIVLIEFISFTVYTNISQNSSNVSKYQRCLLKNTKLVVLCFCKISVFLGELNGHYLSMCCVKRDYCLASKRKGLDWSDPFLPKL